MKGQEDVVCMPREMLEQLISEIISRKFAEHESREDAKLEERLGEFADRAFPGGQLEPHHDYHQAKVDAAIAQRAAAEAQKRFYEAAMKKVVEKGIEGIFDILKVVWRLGLIYVLFRLGFSIPEWMIN